MKRAPALAPLVFWMGAAASGQSVTVYSEFAALTASGDPVDAAATREILSPAVARNAFASFQVSIQVPAGTRYFLFIGQNPEEAVKVTLYTRSGNRLEAAAVPFGGEGPQVLWMDVWVDGSAPVRRVKVEPQLGINDEWFIYPLEVRVMEPVAPKIPASVAVKPALEVLREGLCSGKPPAAGPAVVSVAAFEARNAAQDAALAEVSPEPVRAELKQVMGACTAPRAAPADPEFYLRARDVFFASGKKVR